LESDGEMTLPAVRPAVEFAKTIIKPQGLLVEVGVYECGHAQSMFLHLEAKRIYLIDLIKRVEFPYPHVWWLEDSRTASLKVPNDLDFVYIDADHDEKSVIIDIACWYPKVKVGGIIAGHDYSKVNGVGKAVHRFFGNVQSANVDWWYVKEKEDYPRGLALV
jgi:hypothetical protein